MRHKNSYKVNGSLKCDACCSTALLLLYRSCWSVRTAATFCCVDALNQRQNAPGAWYLVNNMGFKYDDTHVNTHAHAQAPFVAFTKRKP